MAETMLESEATQEALRQKTVTAPAKRELALSSHSEWGRGDWRRGGPGSRRDNRERPALRAAAGPERRATGADRSTGAAPSTVRGGDGLPEA